MTKMSPSLLSLSDDDLMLMFCIRSERLSDPGRWCRDFRAAIQAMNEGPKTSSEADALQDSIQQLITEAAAE
ncbi:hypothetical protein [Sphingorhabdus sp.]|jgi:hypothetical protein|uniref:hypothetical protein n=1 Tax=Sphingorhabdus sp. TaxID=1902408 RepID=UPI0037C5020D